MLEKFKNQLEKIMKQIEETKTSLHKNFDKKYVEYSVKPKDKE